MSFDKPNSSKEAESMIRSFSEFVPAGKLRLFGCECCKNVAVICPEPLIQELIEFGRTRCLGLPDPDELKRLREKSVAVYDSLYPGFGAPSAEVLVLCATGEVAFTESAVDAAVNAAMFAAEAAATTASRTAHEIDYDAVYESALASERDVQASLLLKMCQ